MAIPLPSVPKVRRVRVYPRVSAPLRKRLVAFCAAKGITERDAIEAAIVQFLDGTSDGAQVLARLERIELALDADWQERDKQLRVVHGTSRAIDRAVADAACDLYGRFVTKRRRRFTDDLTQGG